VVGSEVIGMAKGSGRDMVAAPAHPGAPGSGEFFLEARRLSGDRRVLPVFSTVAKLVEALGEAQPWATLPLERAAQLAAEAGIDLVALDPVMSAETWKWGSQNLDEFERRRWSHG
jgi:hypothetical protein